MSESKYSQITKNMKPLTGKKFGRLTVLGFLGKHQFERTVEYYWECRCDCGTVKRVGGGHLRAGKVLSCGCYRDEILKVVNRTHGGTTGRKMAPEFKTWLEIKQRCTNPKNIGYANYGGRGIRMCETWMNSYAQFLKDIGPKPLNGRTRITLDRINNDGNYEPGNCRWADYFTQARNRRGNKIVEYRGKKMTLAELSETVGIEYNILRRRLVRGWSMEKATTHPVMLSQSGALRHAISASSL